MASDKIQFELSDTHAWFVHQLSVHLTTVYAPNFVSRELIGTAYRVLSADMKRPPQDVVAHIAAWETYLERDQQSPIEIRKKRATVEKAFETMRWESVEAVDRPQIMRYRASLVGSTKTAANKLNRLRKFFEYCELCGWIATNPVDGVRAPKVIRGDGVRAFNDVEIRRIIDMTPLPRCNKYAALAYTGLRVGEAKGLLWQQVDITQRMAIFLPASLAKSRRQEAIPLSEHAFRAISAMHHPAVLPTDSVFGPLDDKTLRRDLRRAGVPIIDARGLSAGFHSFRKYFSTALIRGGTKPLEVQKLMRHSSFSTTEKSYIDADQIETAQAVHRVFGSPLQQERNSAETDDSGLTSARDIADTPLDPDGGSEGSSAGKRRGGDSNPRGRLRRPNPSPVPNAFPKDHTPHRDLDEEAAAALAAYLLAKFEMRRYGNGDEERS